MSHLHSARLGALLRNYDWLRSSNYEVDGVAYTSITCRSFMGGSTEGATLWFRFNGLHFVELHSAPEWA